MERSEKGNGELSHAPGSRKPRKPSGVEANMRFPFPALWEVKARPVLPSQVA